MTATDFFKDSLPRPEQKRKMIKAWICSASGSLLRVVGSFGDCPHCLAVCPVGNDYHAYLAEPQKIIPKKRQRR